MGVNSIPCPLNNIRMGGKTQIVVGTKNLVPPAGIGGFDPATLV